MTEITYYPVTLTQLIGKRALVFGGGPVGARKARGLLEVGASVTVISPSLNADLQALADQGRIQWEPRAYQAGDCAGAALVFAATSSRQVNQQITQEAERLNILCNVADASSQGSFHLPAVHRGEDCMITVSSYGRDPAKARQLRDALADWLGEVHGR